MNGKTFFDTNIIIYLYADHEREKQQISKNLIDNAYRCVISTQTLNELSNVLIKKWRMSFDLIKQIQNDIRNISDIMYITEKTIDLAIELCVKYNYSYYDCLMLASALEIDCDIVYTEDMSNGQIINDKLTIINPY